jgi:hypothetical protein
MRDLVVYRQSLTLATKKWNLPYRKNNNKWDKVEHLGGLHDRHDGSLRGAIIKIKTKMEKMRHGNNLPTWKCRMTNKKTGEYMIYYLTCKRIYPY